MTDESITVASLETINSKLDFLLKEHTLEYALRRHMPYALHTPSVLRMERVLLYVSVGRHNLENARFKGQTDEASAYIDLNKNELVSQQYIENKVWHGVLNGERIAIWTKYD